MTISIQRIIQALVALVLTAAVFCLSGTPASAQLKEGATQRELRDLVAPGNRVLVLFDDRTGDIDEKGEYILKYLAEETKWVVTEDLREADFVLYVEGYSEMTRYSLTSKTYFMTPTVRRPDGRDVWTGETVLDWANLGNGMRAVSGVSWKLVVRSLKAGLEKVLGGQRVPIAV